ncbi:PREDICTED: BAI1-associated protein 3-like isoform X2 [Priapulus caudatus]|uniref:BAI1-associated protein 3-like isoform X2 n=1 Tax=Priapulus caudatus TaxID=37621 RepID=A0ABM1EJV1_PRICU|nr:PREDICTED: BAI1-associated protein 3-like isoform X2 [Priapulus caudatus]
MCRWKAYSRKHMEHPFDYAFLHGLLQQLDAKWAASDLSRDEVEEETLDPPARSNCTDLPSVECVSTPPLNKHAEESLAESFNLFIEFCMSLLRKQRDIFPPSNRAASHKLENLLKCLHEIHNLKVFKKCCPFQKELHTEITQIIKKGTLEWYEKQHALTKTTVRSEDDVVSGLIELTNILNSDIQKGQQYYNTIFERVVGVSYTAVTYRQLEKLLSDDVCAAMEDEFTEEVAAPIDQLANSADVTNLKDDNNPIGMQIGTNLFELYLALQEFAQMKSYLPHSETKSLSVSHFHEWFKGAVNRWLKIAQTKANIRIKKAIELDKVTVVDPQVKHSSSAVDTACCFTQIREFWKQLAWPDTAGAYVFVTKVLEDICNGAIFYADEVHKKLQAAGYYDDSGVFDVTEELCITINNIEQVRRSLKPLPEDLRFSEIYHAVDKAYGKDSGRQCKVALYGVLKSSDEDVINKIKEVIEHVGEKMRPDIGKSVFHLAWAPESVPAEDAIESLLSYLDNNLDTLNKSLLRTNFDRLLAEIWHVVLDEIKKMLETNMGKKPVFYSRLYDALDILREFFHANEKGLPMQTIMSREYEALQDLLRLHKSETNTLVDMFYLEKIDIQKCTEDSRFGVLTVRVYYNFSSEELSVEILNAKDIIPLDTNGLSDPFVMIELVPSHNFPTCQVQRTKIVKKSLNPLFDESFGFTVNPDQCRHESAMVQFTVMDHDIMFANDFAGEAYFSLNGIPGLKGEKAGGYSNLKQTQLILTQPKPREIIPKRKRKPSLVSGPFQVLELRTWDKDATEFVKKIKARESLAITK